MQAKLHTFICIKRLEGCKKSWKAMSVEDENPEYGVCDNCYEKACQDEQDILKGVGE